VSNIRNLRKQVAELRSQMRVGSIVATMPDGGTITFPANETTVPRLVLRAFQRAPSRVPGDASPEPPPEPRLDEAIDLILQAEHVRWPDPEDENVPAMLRDLLDMGVGAAGS
jgi:hypothetical protein